MTRTDLLRRTLAVLAIAACLLAVAGVAQAKFAETRSGAVQVSTASMVQPTGIAGSYTCRTGVLTEGVTFTVSGFTDAGPAGATYRFQVFRNGGSSPVTTTTSFTRSATVATPLLGVDLGTTTWTLTVQAVLGNWTSPESSTTVKCAGLSNATGKL